MSRVFCSTDNLSESYTQTHTQEKGLWNVKFKHIQLMHLSCHTIESAARSLLMGNTNENNNNNKNSDKKRIVRYSRTQPFPLRTPHTSESYSVWTLLLNKADVSYFYRNILYDSRIARPTFFFVSFFNCLINTPFLGRSISIVLQPHCWPTKKRYLIWIGFDPIWKTKTALVRENPIVK